MQGSLFSFVFRTRFVLIFRGFHCSKCRNFTSKATDFYEVLGVRRDASGNEIRKAYLNLCKRFHPDANPGQSSASSTRQFQAINEAYSVLSDVVKRRDYDVGQMSPMSRRTSYKRTQGPFYHRPYDDEFKEREDNYKQYPGYQSEYERVRRHEEDVREGRIKPTRTKFSILRLVFGVILLGVVLNILRAISMAMLLEDNRNLTTQQLREMRKIQAARFEGLTREERMKKVQDDIKRKDK